jgi:quinol-cytochrome oxidoreductase complex cytochrome b subunit
MAKSSTYPRRPVLTHLPPLRRQSPSSKQTEPVAEGAAAVVVLAVVVLTVVGARETAADEGTGTTVVFAVVFAVVLAVVVTLPEQVLRYIVRNMST